MQDLPTAAELVEAVREFLEAEIFPEVARKSWSSPASVALLEPLDSISRPLARSFLPSSSSNQNLPPPAPQQNEFVPFRFISTLTPDESTMVPPAPGSEPM